MCEFLHELACTNLQMKNLLWCLFQFEVKHTKDSTTSGQRRFAKASCIKHIHGHGHGREDEDYQISYGYFKLFIVAQ